MDTKKHLISLFFEWSNSKPEMVTPLSSSGSDRKYFRLQKDNISAIGVFHSGSNENQAFVYLTKHFTNHGLPVPELYAAELNNNVYLLEDLGDTTLFDLINKRSKEYLSNTYKKCLSFLADFQVEASKNLDFSYSYPRSKFDKQLMHWDLNYFKYCFIKPTGIHFNEQSLEDDFIEIMDYLLEANANYFMYRDFQSRNIMIKNEQPYFIDYQGGCKGPLQYDLASLLFQSSTELSPSKRTELLNFYLHTIVSKYGIDKDDFMKYYYGFVLLRLLQVLGTYGFRGLIEKKSYFIKSIPNGLKNIKWLFNEDVIPVKINTIRLLINEISKIRRFQPIQAKDKLTVTISSFSYKKGIPDDITGHGGGFVFDCRLLPNPGKIEKYSPFNGKQKEVINFMLLYREVEYFMKNVYEIVDSALQNYLSKGFKNLIINFGCTGGQHRSVYCAERLKEHLNSKFDIYINIIHTQLDE